MAKTATARKGDHFEGGVLLPYLRDQLGAQVCRPRTSGHGEIGDFAGIPDWTFQAKAYTDMLRAIREGLDGAAAQRLVAGTTYAAAIVKRPRITAPERQLLVMELGWGIPLIRETARWEALDVGEGAA
jgi:hypothetical protein